MDRKFIKYVPVVLLTIVVLLSLIPRSPAIQVVGVSSGPQQNGPPLVQAILVNDGSATDAVYWVAIPGEETPFCTGKVTLGEKERQELRFACPALDGYSGNFVLEAEAVR